MKAWTELERAEGSEEESFSQDGRTPNDKADDNSTRYLFTAQHLSESSAHLSPTIPLAGQVLIVFNFYSKQRVVKMIACKSV